MNACSNPGVFWAQNVPLGLPPFLVPLLIFTKALAADHTLFSSVGFDSLEEASFSDLVG